MEPDELEQWLARCDAQLEAGVDAFTAVTATDPRNSVQGSVQLALDLRG